MSATAVALPPPRAYGRGAWAIAAAVILLATFAIRSIHFGNPVMHVDEDFYLLVGDRMLHQGMWPYIDIWDRKPVGIFVVYWLIRMLGGEGFYQYQIVATLFAAATAFCIARIATRFTTLGAGVWAGLIYVVAIGLYGGEGGQTPVFYNLLTAWAAMATMRAALDPAPAPGLIRRQGAIAMAITGVAMQIKYNIMFEGIFFALLLLWRGWKADPRIAPRLIDATLWAGLALLPTAIAFAVYLAAEQGEIFFYSNFVSIIERPKVDNIELLGRLWKIVRGIAPLFVALGLAMWKGPWRAAGEAAADAATDAGAAHRFALMWVAAAVIGFLIFGTYYNHYILPVLLPLVIGAAPAFTLRRKGVAWGTILAFLLFAVGLTAYNIRAHKRQLRSGNEAYIRPIARIIKAHLGKGCLYVHDGETILYYLTGSCLPTRWIFANHLNTGVEAPAIGTDAAAEVARTFARKPSVVATTLNRVWDVNAASRAVADRALARDYQLIYTTPIDEELRAIYVRKPGR